MRRKVAIYARTYPPRSGGVSVAHYHLAQCLAEQHEVKIFAYEDDAESESNIIRRKSPRWLSNYLKWYARRKVTAGKRQLSSAACEGIARIVPAVFSLNRELRKFSPDFILCPDNQLPATSLSKPAGSKLIWMAHHNYQRFKGNPLISGRARRGRDLELAHSLEKKALGKADAVVAVSDYMHRVTIATLGNNKPVFVIKNHVNLDQTANVQPSALRADLGLSDSTRLIYIPSAGSAIKGERYVFEIIRRLGSNGNAAFFLSGNITAALQYELKALPDSIPVYCPGQQSYTDNLADVAACDLCVSPTLLENYSNAILEALSLSIPVVSFDVGGNDELVNHGENGFLVPYLDMDALVTSAASLLEDRERLEAFKSECANGLVSSSADCQRVTAEFEEMFEVLSANE